MIESIIDYYLFPSFLCFFFFFISTIWAPMVSSLFLTSYLIPYIYLILMFMYTNLMT